jgi:hypothetical protein
MRSQNIQDHWTSSMQSKQLLLLQHLQILNPVYHQTAVTNPMMKAAYSPTKGGKPAKIANDNDSESWSWQQLSLLKFRFIIYF